jgi:outer membrane receptor protein involved in Fe transport
VRGFSSQPLYNGFQTGLLNVTNEGIDRVEVTKGPNSILYGQSSAGGTINFVPKGAMLAGARTSASAGIATNDGYRASFETGGAVAGKPGTGFRLGGGYQEFTREQQFFWNSQAAIYGGYRTNLTDKITFEMNAERSRKKTNPARTEAFVSLGSGPARVTDPYNRLRKDRNFNYHGPWSEREGDTWVSSGYLTAQINTKLTLRLGALYSRQNETANVIDGVYGLNTAATATGYYQDGTRRQVVNGFKADLLYQTELGRFAVDTIIGFESHDSRDRFNQFRTNPAVTPITITIPFTRKPVEGDYPRPPARSLYTNWSAGTLDELSWTNLRFTQFVTAPGNRATLMWGVARGEGDNVTSDFRTQGTAVATGRDTTYTVGGTFVLHASDRGKLIAFANTSTSFLIQRGNKQNPQDFTGFTSVAALRAFVDTVKPNAIDPQTGEGFEAGVRYSMADGRFRAELLGYQQERSNIARQFFVRESNVVGELNEQVIATYQLASGREQSRGIELSVDWRPNRAFSIYASGVISDGEVKSNPEAPEEVGFQLVRSPEKMWNFWARYAPDAGRLRGFVAGLGASYRNSTRTRPELNDRFRLSDDYTVARALIAYEFSGAKAKHAVSLNIDNLLDEEYVAENAILSEPITFRFNYKLTW